jgi:AcrR family transcriptional regulator
VKKRATERKGQHNAEGSKRLNKHHGMRADAQQKMSSVLQAALEVFAKSGVDAPVREIAERAGVGLGTVYRHYPKRSDLIVAVFQKQIDACAEAASVYGSKLDPDAALTKWMLAYVDLISTKRGLAAALHSGDPAYSALPTYFFDTLRPALNALLDTAAKSGAIRARVSADDLLLAAASLARPKEGDVDYPKRIVRVLVDGLRYGACGRSTT